MFYHREDGYLIDIFNKTITANCFFADRIIIREGGNNYLLCYILLFNQYLVDVSTKIETENLNYIRFQQKQLRTDN